MRRVLAAAVLVAFMPAAHAQDKGKSEFTHDAEYRVRYDYFQNITGQKDVVGNTSAFDHRFKLDLGFRANEKVSAGVTLLHNATWGMGDNNTVGTYDATTGAGTKTEQNFMAVNQAYANWMVNDAWSVKFGRMNYQIGDGTIMGLNDWEATPYAYEGALVNWQAEFGRFQAFGFKYHDSKGIATSLTATDSDPDPETNAFGLNFDLKTMPEWLKVVNAHVIATNGAATQDGTSTYNAQTTQDGQSTVRYGAKAGFGFSIVDLSAWYEGQSGKLHHLATAAHTKTDNTVKGDLIQAEVGVNLPEFMGSRIYFRFHQDSGDKDSTDQDAGTYDGYFTTKHCSTGCMDLFGWGNMTFWNLGWTAKPTDNTDVGVSYWMFSRTEKGLNAAGVVNGDYGSGLVGTTSTANGSTSDKIGSEVDLWATHKYDGNLWTTARIGYFSPDTYLKDASKKDGITQVMLEGKFTF